MAYSNSCIITISDFQGLSEYRVYCAMPEVLSASLRFALTRAWSTRVSSCGFPTMRSTVLQSQPQRNAAILRNASFWAGPSFSYMTYICEKLVVNITAIQCIKVLDQLPKHVKISAKTRAEILCSPIQLVTAIGLRQQDLWASKDAIVLKFYQ